LASAEITLGQGLSIFRSIPGPGRSGFFNFSSPSINLFLYLRTCPSFFYNTPSICPMDLAKGMSGDVFSVLASSPRCIPPGLHFPPPFPSAYTRIICSPNPPPLEAPSPAFLAPSDTTLFSTTPYCLALFSLLGPPNYYQCG